MNGFWSKSLDKLCMSQQIRLPSCIDETLRELTLLPKSISTLNCTISLSNTHTSRTLILDKVWCDFGIWKRISLILLLWKWTHQDVGMWFWSCVCAFPHVVMCWEVTTLSAGQMVVLQEASGACHMICVSSEGGQRSSTAQHVQHCVYNIHHTETLR